MSAEQNHLPRARTSPLKRLEDLVLGGAALVLAIPLLGTLAFAVRLNSAGPVFFRQKRRGLDGKEFCIYKLRTMAEAPAGEQDKGRRITALGKWLRATTLDELPQLVNVLQGHLSLVGPRPHEVSEDQYYAETIENYRQRYRVKPGMTGQAQVHGLIGPVTSQQQMRQRLEHDLDYIQNWSLWRDLVILAKTPPVMLRTGNRAAPESPAGRQ